MDICVPSSVDESSGYHMDCYGIFIALVKPDREYLATLHIEQKKVSSTKTRSSTVASFIATTAGVFVKQCIFCKKKDQKFKGAKQTLIMVSTENIEKNIKRYADILKDENLLRLILDEDFVSKEICYNSICRAEYQSRAKLVSSRSSKQEKERKMGRMNLGGTFLEGSITKLSKLFRPLLIYKLSKIKKYFSPETSARNTVHCFRKLAVINLKTLPNCTSLKPS